jgi:hypothetical protein
VTTPEILARRGGWCELCKLRIRKGEDYVSPLPHKKWGHSLCVQGYNRVIEEHREGDAA